MPTHVTLLLLHIFVLSLAFYFVLRYRGMWSETDTNVLTRLIGYMIESGTLVPGKEAYAQGYGYPVLATFLIRLTGVDLLSFQLLFAPFLIAWVVLPAWLLYREFLQSSRGATLATVFLFIQPEFLFVLLRSSHEKFTRGLMLLAFYLLVRSLRARQRARQFVAFILAFYLSIYALITMNNLMATSYIAGLMLALLGLWFLGRLKLTTMTHVPLSLSKRFQYVVVISLLISFLFTFYAYQPAKKNIHTLDTAWNKITALILDFQFGTSENEEDSVVVNPYGVVNRDWVNYPTYLVFTAANWLILLGSTLIWLYQTFQLLYRRVRMNEQTLLLWTFFGSFSLLSALSIVADISGFLSSNLQLRIFPSFAMLAVAVVVSWLISAPIKRYWWSQTYRYTIAVTIAIFSVLSLIKATNEPLLTNNWIFTEQSEQQALLWVDKNSISSSTWTEVNERLTTIYETLHGPNHNQNRLDKATIEHDTTNFLISRLTQLRSTRFGSLLPAQADNLRIYDNGDSTIYRRRSVTPYQK